MFGPWVAPIVRADLADCTAMDFPNVVTGQMIYIDDLGIACVKVVLSGFRSETAVILHRQRAGLGLRRLVSQACFSVTFIGVDQRC